MGVIEAVLIALLGAAGALGLGGSDLFCECHQENIKVEEIEEIPSKDKKIKAGEIPA